MARNRNRNQDSNNEGESTMSSTETAPMFTPIDDEATLAEILASSHGRGEYKAVLQAFLNAEVRLAEIPVGERKAQTVKTGFENAKTGKEPPEGSANVKVIKKNDKVYLLNNAVTA